MNVKQSGTHEGSHAERGRSAFNIGYKLQSILSRAGLKAQAALWRRISLGRAF